MATANMGLSLSSPGVTNDLTAAQNIETNWPILDVHDHSSGKGSQVVSAGININANLSFAGYKPYNLLCAQFNSQTSSLSTATNKPCVYVLNGELRFIDSSSNDVQITNSGNVAGTSGSIGGLSSPASAQFSTNTFLWKSAATTYAKMASGDLQIYEASAAISNFITLKSPAALAASYTITLPTAVPGSTQYVAMSSSGALSTVTSNTISEARTRATGTTVAVGGVAISASSGTANITPASPAYSDVTNLSVTITTSGRPVQLMMIGNYFGLSSGLTVNMTLAFDRGGSNIVLSNATMSDTTNPPQMPASSFNYVDAVAAGTYTYKVRVTEGSSRTVRFQDCYLVAYEL